MATTLLAPSSARGGENVPAGTATGQISALKKRSSRIFNSLLKKASFSKKSPALGKAEQRRAATLASLREMQSRGPAWWANVTREVNLANAYKSSLEKLVRAINHAEGISEFEMAPVMPASIAEDVEEGIRYYRCDIQPEKGTDYATAELDCIRTIMQAGGEILSDFEYVGGFLYSMPTGQDGINPLADLDDKVLGATVSVTPWSIFGDPRWNTLHAQPSGPVWQAPVTFPEADDAQPIETTPKQKMQDWISKQKTKASKQQKQPFTTLTRDLSSDLNLTANILDPGIELAILDPGRIRSSIYRPRFDLRDPGPRASFAEKEVCSTSMTTKKEDEEGDTKSEEYVLTHEGNAFTMSITRMPAPRPVVRPFAEEMKSIEDLYRGWYRR